MKIRNIILCLILIVCSMLNIGGDFKEFLDLKNYDVPVIKKDDLPDEFSNNAYEVIVDFIQKTRGLEKEWVLFFDYVTGEILKCAKGKQNKVNVDFDDDEFEDHCVASIHNHPINAFSPPSGKNFNIFCRGFEDYELIVGRNGLWILKAKGIYNNIIEEVRKASLFSYIVTLSQCKNSETTEKMNNCEDLVYGEMLSTYINDKNIKDIQLTKMEYVTMDINSKSGVAEFEHFESPSSPEDWAIIQNFIDNPDLEENKQRITKFFAKMNVEINADELAREMPRYKKLLNF